MVGFFMGRLQHKQQIDTVISTALKCLVLDPGFPIEV